MWKPITQLLGGLWPFGAEARAAVVRPTRDATRFAATDRFIDPRLLIQNCLPAYAGDSNPAQNMVRRASGGQLQGIGLSRARLEEVFRLAPGPDLASPATVRLAAPHPKLKALLALLKETLPEHPVLIENGSGFLPTTLVVGENLGYRVIGVEPGVKMRQWASEYLVEAGLGDRPIEWRDPEQRRGDEAKGDVVVWNHVIAPDSEMLFSPRRAAWTYPLGLAPWDYWTRQVNPRGYAVLVTEAPFLDYKTPPPSKRNQWLLVDRKCLPAQDYLFASTLKGDQWVDVWYRVS